MTLENAKRKLQILKGWFKSDSHIYEALDIVLEALEQQISQEQKWILCSEQTPEHLDRVLTTIKVSALQPQVRSGTYVYGLFNNDNGDTWDEKDKEVIAWMPLPKPYKKGDENETD